MAFPYEISIEQISGKFEKLKSPDLPPQIPTAAVLILLIEKHEIEVVFTQRSEFVRNHKNEVAFPGGAYEKEDKTLYHTALRETCEEISICSNTVHFMGALNSFTTHYDLVIYPYVASIDNETFLSAHPDEEVTAIFSIPLGWLMDAGNWEYRPYQSGTQKRDVIFYHAYQGYTVWGMTARILQNFIELIKK